MGKEDIIGIVGGIGPYAGVDLVKKIFDQTVADTDQDHISVYLISESSKIEDRTAFLQGKVKDNPGYSIANIIKKLESIGVNIIAISCNTAHSPRIYNVILNELKKSRSKVKLLHIAKETVKFINENYSDIKNIGILGTKGTIRTNIYGLLLKKRGFLTINLNERTQELVHNAIYDKDYGIKAISNPVTQKAKREINMAINYLKLHGAEGAVLGCTELPLAIQERKINGVHIFDPTDILARSLVNIVAPEKLKPMVCS